MTAKLLMIQGTSSGAGKSTLVIGLCRAFSDIGYKVSPFKAQNMTSNFFTLSNSTNRIAVIQAIQAFASRNQPDIRMNPILLEPIGDDRSNIFLNGLFVGQMTSEEYYENFVLKQGFSTVLQSLDELRQNNITEKITKKEILGIVPRIEFTLPAEDSLDEIKVSPAKQSPESLDEQVNILASRLKESLDINKIASELLQLE